MTVSRRAARLAAEPPAIAAAHLRAEAAPYHPDHRPDGFVNLGTAENRLVWDLLAPRLTARRALTAQDTYYAPLHGTPALREVVAGFLSGVCRTAMDPEHLVVVSGATAALDLLASTLCDPGEAIVVPAPYYAAFELDLGGRSGARMIPAPAERDEGFRVTAESLDRVLVQARRDGVTVRAIALSSPSNPVGHVYATETLREVADVAARHDVDIITDEIYANSVFGATPFVSLLDSRVDSARPERTHMVWGFAKDFGLPGCKIGVLYSPNPRVVAAARALAYFAPTSTDTQALAAELLADPSWVDRFTTESRRRLGASYARCAGLLDDLGIPYVPAGAGFSVWIDLRGRLAEPTFAAERELWSRIFDDARVSILPGEAFGSPEPGWFRVCHATEPAIVSTGITRLGRVLEPLVAKG
jgi:aspartate/methionine/tyrosine aminotransferase